MALLVIILDSSSCFFYVDFALVAFKYLHGFICGKANLLRLSRDSWAALVAQVEKQHAPWRWHSWNASGAAHMHSLPADIWGLCLQILFNMSLEMQHSAAFIRRWSKWQGIDFFFFVLLMEAVWEDLLSLSIGFIHVTVLLLVNNEWIQWEGSQMYLSGSSRSVCVLVGDHSERAFFAY